MPLAHLGGGIIFYLPIVECQWAEFVILHNSGIFQTEFFMQFAILQFPEYVL
jgi:hypothetical protein